MSEQKKTLGQAIDDIIEALESLSEAQRATAIRAACEALGIEDFSASPVDSSVGKEHTSMETQQPRTHTHKEIRDIRSLKHEKQPKTAQEMACIVAYYLEALAPPKERKTEIKHTDLEKYFKQAQYRLPKRIKQVLVDAKAAGYFDSPGRGRYKLNPVGHNLVVHVLPRTKS